MSVRVNWLGLAAAAGLAVGAFAAEESSRAELILHHGRVVTVDDQFSIQEAIAVRGDQVLAVGRDADVLSLGGGKTEVIDLQGRMVIPGLLDSHAHPIDAAVTEFDHAIPTMERIQDVLTYIAERTRVVPEGKWIVVRQVFITRLQEQRYPTRAELDHVAPRHPVMFATGPDASLNTLALQRSGINRDFKVSDGGTGFAEKDSRTGEPTGILRNCARFVKPDESTRAPTAADRADRLVELFADYNSVGLTGVCDRDASPEDIDLYRSLREKGRLTVRVRISQHVESIGAMEAIREQIRKVAQDPLFQERDDWLRIIGVKTYLDGGMLTGSAYLRQPWGVSDVYGITDPAYRGVLFIPKDKLKAMARTAAQAKLQFTAHSVGDGAVHTLLEAYEEVSGEVSLAESRPCVSHSNFMSREAVELAARLGVMLDLQPAWLFLDTRTLVKQFGYDRLRYFQPLRSLFDAGVVAAGGSDHMQKIGAARAINPYSPFLGMATAVTRRAKAYSGSLHPEESLTREQALRFYTRNAARVMFLDDRAGAIEKGKLADLVVIDTDLLECPSDAIARTQVLRTYVGGKLVYRR